MAKTISEEDFEAMKGCAELIDVQLASLSVFNNVQGESLHRAEEQVKKLRQIIERVERENDGEAVSEPNFLIPGRKRR